MEDDRKALEERVVKLARELEDVRRRLSEVEARLPSSEGADGPAEVAPPEPPRVGSTREPREGEEALREPVGMLLRVLTLAGRTFVILGGAYLLRALSDAGVLPAALGAAAGLVYAAVWLAAADRAADRGDRLGAGFHGLTAMLVAFPLVWETTARLRVLPTWLAALVLLALAAAALAVAWRRGLPEVAWAGVLGTSVSALGLAITTHDPVPFTALAVAVLAATEVMAVRDRWLELLWPPALAADVLVVHATILAAHQGAPAEGLVVPGAAAAVVLALALLGLSVVGASARTLKRHVPVGPFEILQTAAAVIIGAGGTVRVLAAHGVQAGPVGGLLLVLGVGATAAAFAVLRARPESRATVVFYATCGAGLVVGGVSLLLQGRLLAVVFALGGVVVTVVARGPVRRILLSYAAVLLTAAGVVSGLLGGSTARLLGALGAGWAPLDASALLSAAATFVCFLYLATHRPTPGLRWWGLLPRAAVAGLTVWEFAALVVGALSGLVGHLWTLGPAEVATIRTLAVVVVAVGCAWAAGQRGIREVGWLVYPLLAAGAAKLLLEDLRHGRPLTLFLSLALYGCALLAAPRLLRRTGGE